MGIPAKSGPSFSSTFSCGCDTCREEESIPPSRKEREEGEKGKEGWRKVLYIAQPYADNHTDKDTFLADMVLNADVSTPSYWPTVEASLVVAHQVATVSMVVSVFAFQLSGVLSLASLHSLNLSFLVGGLALAALAQADEALRSHDHNFSSHDQNFSSHESGATVMRKKTNSHDLNADTDEPPRSASDGAGSVSPEPYFRNNSKQVHSAQQTGGCKEKGNGESESKKDALYSSSRQHLHPQSPPPTPGSSKLKDDGKNEFNKEVIYPHSQQHLHPQRPAPPGSSTREGDSTNEFKKKKIHSNSQQHPQPQRRAPQAVLLAALKEWWSVVTTCTIMGFYMLLLSPVLHTLTRSISSDTIWCTTTYLLLFHLFLHDYSYSAALSSTFSSYLALLSALFACVLLASRLPLPSGAYAFVSFGLLCFGLLPGILHKVALASDRSHRVVVILLLMLSLGLVCHLSVTWGLVLVGLLLFVVFICPGVLVHMYRSYKSSIQGPWDEAKLQVPSEGK